MTPWRVAEDYPRWREVLALIRAEFADMEGRIDPPSSVLRLTAEAMARSAAEGAVFVAEEAGRPVACVVCRAEGDALELGKLAVAGTHRGRGLARALIAAAEAEARGRGLAALTLRTRIELTGNHVAFARLGFARVGETAHPGFDRPTSITMRKPLRPSRPGADCPTLTPDPHGRPA